MTASKRARNETSRTGPGERSESDVPVGPESRERPASDELAGPEPGEQTATDDRNVATVRVPRWRVGVPAALALVTLGILYASPLLLASAVLPLGYLVYGALSTVPANASVKIERALDDESPAPGERTTVSVTVTNDSAATLPDVRIVDGLPGELAVTGGSPRRSLTLQPGESATYAYDVVARRGEFTFDDALARVRSLAGSTVRTESVPVAGASRLTCLHPLTDATSEASARRRTGTHPTDSGGPGTEFHSTRAYRRGDSIHRIHWRRFARTGELTTVAYREERGVSTVLIVDGRPVGRVSPQPGVPTATDLCTYAGERLYDALTDAGVVTSVTALGVETDDPAVPTRVHGIPWADGDAPDATTRARAVFETVRTAPPAHSPPVASQRADGRDHDIGNAERGIPAGIRETVTGLVSADDRSGNPAADPTDPETDAGADGPVDAGSDAASATDRDTAAPDGGPVPVHLLGSQLPANAEVVLLSPLLDDWPLSLVETLRSQEYRVTVVSPDVTDTGTVGGRVAGIERRARLRDVGAIGATTVGWTPGDSLETALARSVTHLVGRGA